mgnify:CR=1 FL=1
MARLTDAQVVRLRERYAAGERQVDLAAAFGIAQNSVSAIVTGRTRAGAGGPIAESPARAKPTRASSPRTRLTEETAAEVRRRVGDGERRADVAAALGISRFSVDSIMSGRRGETRPGRGLSDDAVARIRALAAQGLSQTAIAREVGTSQQMVSKTLREGR